MAADLPIDATGLTVMRGGRALLRTVDLAVQPGELLVVVGPNGAGKSTLIRTLLGRIAPDAGTVRVFGDEVGRLRAPDRAERMAWLPQTAALAEPVRVVEQVMASRFRLSESRTARHAAALVALQRVGLRSLHERDATTLSGGEAQRVGLACLIAQEARIWLLDEPANHLDPAVQDHVLQVVIEAWRAGRSVVLVTHDPDRVLSRVPDGPVRVVGMRDGEVVMRAPAHDAELAAQLSHVYGVPMVAVDVHGVRRLLFEARP